MITATQRKLDCVAQTISLHSAILNVAIWRTHENKYLHSPCGLSYTDGLQVLLLFLFLLRIPLGLLNVRDMARPIVMVVRAKRCEPPVAPLALFLTRPCATTRNWTLVLIDQCFLHFLKLVAPSSWCHNPGFIRRCDVFSANPPRSDLCISADQDADSSI